MISVCAKICDVSDEEEHLDRARVMDLAKSMGVANPRQLEIAARLPPNNLEKYFSGVSPRSHLLLRLTELLGAPPSYLYGKPMDQVKRNVVAMVRKTFGSDEATALEIFSAMTREQKAAFLRMLDAFAGPEQEPSAFQRDATELVSKPGHRHAAHSKKK